MQMFLMIRPVKGHLKPADVSHHHDTDVVSQHERGIWPVASWHIRRWKCSPACRGRHHTAQDWYNCTPTVSGRSPLSSICGCSGLSGPVHTDSPPPIYL